MLTLYITRHGETEWNKQKRLQGWSDSDLTDKGIANAISLGERLKSINLNAIYSSPSKRASDTAKLICGDKDIPIIYEDKLKEIYLGSWEGRTQSELEENYPSDYYSFWNTPHLYTSKDCESFGELQTKLVDVLHTIKEKNISGNILIVTHAVVIKTLMAYFKNVPVAKLWDPPFIHDTSLTVVEVTGNEYRIMLEGDLAHREQ
ncbi:histidine phosphatase family protein [Halalkalibacter urbisdiaboli]|uniref:histidine phosphatase family protein n=1 Tax=Halalkalibacter urbisdiaboli TaxID=1960589 RepID=UPI000B43CA6B|nr:histidine phosphatase family protein [Halalkalibacter urbisdiaboli]